MLGAKVEKGDKIRFGFRKVTLAFVVRLDYRKAKRVVNVAIIWV